MHEPLKNRTFQGKKLLFNFLGANFLAPKSGHRHKKQPVLGPRQPAPSSAFSIAKVNHGTDHKHRMAEIYPSNFNNVFFVEED